MKKMNKKVSVIIPTLNAGHQIQLLLEKIYSQTVNVDEIIIVDSESEDDTVQKCTRKQNVKVIEISRKEFDHGGTRDMALKTSVGDYIIFLTQDAVPLDEYCFENLVKFFDDPLVAVVCGRQIARSDATKMEQLVREFNYPAESCVRSKEDIAVYGIKTFFCSDVCAAYRRDIYEKLGGFEHPLITNEDMFYAAKAIQNGYKTAYSAEAKIIHSHNFSLKEQYDRNYIQGIEIEKHKELLGNTSKNAEGLKMVKYVSARLLKRGHVVSLVLFFLDCIARYMGSKAGSKKGRKFVEKKTDKK